MVGPRAVCYISSGVYDDGSLGRSTRVGDGCVVTGRDIAVALLKLEI